MSDSRFEFANEGPPYTRAELKGVGDSLPTRGPVCPRCNQHIPQFVELSAEETVRIRTLIVNGQKALATAELRAATGCPLTWAKLWVLHSGRPDSVDTTAPCPYCGKPLKTARARQCPLCFMDWHEPENPRSLK